MNVLTHQFQNLDGLIDQVHALFTSCAERNHTPHPIDPDAFHHLEIAVHEWLANLVQHAEFTQPAVDISLSVETHEGRLRCVIKDNSNGFDLTSYLSVEPSYFQTFPERGMGLLILKICTEGLVYHRTKSGHNHLEFYVSANGKHV